MRNLEYLLKKKKINYNKLIKYGFKKENEKYTYKKNILDNEFRIYISIDNDKKYSKLIEVAFNDEYALVDVEEAVGEFVGKVKEEYDRIIFDIIDKCSEKEVFKSKQTKDIIEYVRKKYNDELEFLWEKYDDNAIWRNKENDKWYGLVLTIKKEKLGIKSDKVIEILDLRYQKDDIEKIVDNKNVFPGYHMNKKSWITVKLDNSIKNEEIYKLIDNSYELSLGEKKVQKIDELSKKVYEYLTKIPKGKVVTYKQVAEHLGNKGLARIVGTILHRNPDGDKYPCYKVLNSKGELADAFVFGGKEVQKERLEKDGIDVIDNRVDLSIYKWNE